MNNKKPIKFFAQSFKDLIFSYFVLYLPIIVLTPRKEMPPLVTTYSNPYTHTIQQGIITLVLANVLAIGAMIFEILNYRYLIQRNLTIKTKSKTIYVYITSISIVLYVIISSITVKLDL